MLENGMWYTEDREFDELVVSPVLMETPENAAKFFGTEDCMKACDEKLGIAKLSTAEDNDELYNRVNNILLDEEDEATDEGRRAEAQRAEVMRQALDSLSSRTMVFWKMHGMMKLRRLIILKRGF